MEIRGSAAVVTGGGSGLGEATAREIVARGGRVLILDLARSKGAELAKSLGPAALFGEADVTNEAQVAAAVDRAVRRIRRDPRARELRRHRHARPRRGQEGRAARARELPRR